VLLGDFRVYGHRLIVRPLRQVPYKQCPLGGSLGVPQKRVQRPCLESNSISPVCPNSRNGQVLSVSLALRLFNLSNYSVDFHVVGKYRSELKAV
jgi:hypothetical protein